MSTTPSLTTVRGRIERAEKALRTGQPNLAVTYMRAARSQIFADRIARFAPEERVFEIFNEAIKLIGEAARDTGRGIALTAKNIGQAVQGERQSDYALAAGRSA